MEAEGVKGGKSIEVIEVGEGEVKEERKAGNQGISNDELIVTKNQR